MRLLSKVLKHVDFEKENPLSLIDYSGKKSDKKSLNKTANMHQRFYENQADQVLEGALDKAQKILKQAKQESVKIISEAQEKKQKLEKEAFNKGYEDGYDDGIIVSKKKQEALWEEYMIELNKSRQEIVNQNKIFKDYLFKECIKLALTIAEKILGKKIEVNGAYLLKLAKNGLRKAGGEKDAIIRVSETDYIKVEPSLYDFKKESKNITLIKDPFFPLVTV